MLLRELPALLDRLRESADLTIVRADRLSAKKFFGKDFLAVPEWIDMRLAVPGDLDERSAQEWAEVVREKLEESVRLHLRSDVPLGCYLSSGIDSSAMAGLMSREISDPILTFSVAFEDPLFNEIGLNRILADISGYNLRNHITTCRTADFDLLPEMIWHREDPNMGGIPHMLLAKLAAQEVKGVLTGEGSDEIFGGYPWYRVERLLQPFINLPLSVRQLIASIPFLRKKWSRSSRAFATHATMDLPRYTQIIDNASNRSYDDLFSDHLRSIVLSPIQNHISLFRRILNDGVVLLNYNIWISMCVFRTSSRESWTPPPWRMARRHVCRSSIMNLSNYAPRFHPT